MQVVGVKLRRDRIGVALEHKVTTKPYNLDPSHTPAHSLCVRAYSDSHEPVCDRPLQVLVYNFADLRLLHSIETLSNLSGLLAFSAQPEHTVLACPGLHAGQARAARIQNLSLPHRMLIPEGLSQPCFTASLHCKLSYQHTPTNTHPHPDAHPKFVWHLPRA
jgi:hypothetical protein